MTVFDLRNSEGQIYAFEVENSIATVRQTFVEAPNVQLWARGFIAAVFIAVVAAIAWGVTRHPQRP
jgi:hypothetical protein